MPDYTHQCSCGRVFSDWRSMARSHDAVPCPDCGAQAPVNTWATVAPALALEPTGAPVSKVRMRNAETWSGLSMRPFICDECGHEDDIIIDWEAGETLQTPRQCETCGKTMRHVVGFAVDESLKRYPYFDMGLGCQVTSKDHRAQIMRERGLTCLDGEAGAHGEAILAAQEASRQADIAAYAADLEFYRTGPDPEIRRRYGEMVDAGQDPAKLITMM